MISAFFSIMIDSLDQQKDSFSGRIHTAAGQSSPGFHVFACSLLPSASFHSEQSQSPQTDCGSPPVISERAPTLLAVHGTRTKSAGGLRLSLLSILIGSGTWRRSVPCRFFGFSSRNILLCHFRMLKTAGRKTHARIRTPVHTAGMTDIIIRWQCAQRSDSARHACHI